MTTIDGIQWRFIDSHDCNEYIYFLYLKTDFNDVREEFSAFSSFSFLFSTESLTSAEKRKSVEKSRQYWLKITVDSDQIRAEFLHASLLEWNFLQSSECILKFSILWTILHPLFAQQRNDDTERSLITYQVGNRGLRLSSVDYTLCINHTNK